MKALQYRTIGESPEVVEIDTPEPGPGEVRLKVTAAGACHSDEFVMGLGEEDYQAAGYPLPLTLGHEIAGVVDKVGEGVSAGVNLGDSVVVYGPWGCGFCYDCSQGHENYCQNVAELGIKYPGLGAPGGMAEYVIIDSTRHLVPLGDLDPIECVSLTDAALTPYHAIKGSLSKLQPGSTAVVIGAGGLGHVALQILRAITGATVVALDVNDQKLDFAREVGAHHAFLSEESAIEEVRKLTGGLGANAVFDFVTVQPTMDLGQKMLRVGGDHVLLGAGGGSLPAGMFGPAWNSAVRAPVWGYRQELFEVVELARSGAIRIETETFSLDEADKAYAKLHAGELRGRGVVVPR